MAAGSTKKRKRAFGLPLPALLAVACLLVIVGIAGGIGLDIALRPDPEPARPQTRPTQQRAPNPVVRNAVPDEDEGARPSIFAPRGASEGTPRAPEAPAAPSMPSPPPPRGNQPMVAYAVGTTVPRSRPVLAIVIDDMGVDRTHSLKMIALPGPLTISLMTYASDLNGLSTQAREAGHEVMAHVPMQPISAKENPGPNALTVTMDDAAIRAALAKDLDPWRGYVGINNHMGSRFTMDAARMAIVMDELKARGLLWLDSKTIANSAGIAAARTAGVPYVERDIFLDNVETVSAILEQLDRAVATAKSKGVAIAIGHPHETTVAALKQALPGLEARGVSLVPVTEILRRRKEPG